MSKVGVETTGVENIDVKNTGVKTHVKCQSTEGVKIQVPKISASQVLGVKKYRYLKYSCVIPASPTRGYENHTRKNRHPRLAPKLVSSRRASAEGANRNFEKSQENSM